MEWQKGEYSISTEPGRLDIPYIHSWLSERSYWAGGIPLETVKRALEGSVCFGIYASDKQVGFARVVTDGATFGYIADVFVDEGQRGKGLSKWMMDVIMSHPDLQGFRTWMLQTMDAHGLYSRSGFKAHEHPERMMMKSVPDIYRKGL